MLGKVERAQVLEILNQETILKSKLILEYGALAQFMSLLEYYQ